MGKMADIGIVDAAIPSIFAARFMLPQKAYRRANVVSFPNIRKVCMGHTPRS
jgi:hypothetical protein